MANEPPLHRGSREELIPSFDGEDQPVNVPIACVPDLPRDLLRAIWQRAWHDAAAGRLQRAWRASRMRQAWGQWSSRRCLFLNVDFCASIEAVKYLHKYIYKLQGSGPCRFGLPAQRHRHDEVASYEDMRYFGAAERV